MKDNCDAIFEVNILIKVNIFIDLINLYKATLNNTKLLNN